MRAPPARRPPATGRPVVVTAAATALVVAASLLLGSGVGPDPDRCGGTGPTSVPGGAGCVAAPSPSAEQGSALPIASARPAPPTSPPVSAAPAPLPPAVPDPPVGALAPAPTAPPAAPAVADPALPPADPASPALVVTPDEDAPNPFVLVDGDRHLMYATETRGHFYELLHIPIRTSTDLRTWTLVGDALPVLPAWAAPGATWAPDVMAVDGGNVLYVTARLRGQARPTQCIGAATAATALGPFAPAPEPLVCQVERRGSIDPRSFVGGDGQRWLHWKSDDNADTEGSSTSSIYAQRLDDTGLELVGQPVRILEVDQRWEGRIVEAPDLHEGPDGRLWLFYSGNWFNQPAYGLGVALCETPAGPCTKPFDGPWLASNDQGAGPGEGALFTDLEGRTWIAYSPVAQRFDRPTKRPVALGRVAFDAVGPYLADPGSP